MKEILERIVETYEKLVAQYKDYINYINKPPEQQYAMTILHLKKGIEIRESELSSLQSLKEEEEKVGRGNCPDCNGFGYTAEHNPADPHPNGECSGGCPIQVQCPKCNATGWIETPAEPLTELRKELIKFNLNDHIYIQINKSGWDHLKKTVGDDYIKACIDPYSKVINNEVWYSLQAHQVFDLFPMMYWTETLIGTNIMLDKNVLIDLTSNPK